MRRLWGNFRFPGHPESIDNFPLHPEGGPTNGTATDRAAKTGRSGPAGNVLASIGTNPSNEFLFTATVAKTPVAALVDLGATGSFCLRAWAQKMGLHIEPYSATAAPAAGQPLGITGRTKATLKLGPGNFKYHIRLYVVDSLIHDVVLGLPFLQKVDPATSFRAMTMTIPPQGRGRKHPRGTRPLVLKVIHSKPTGRMEDGRIRANTEKTAAAASW